MSKKQETKKLEEYYASLPEWYWKHGLHDAEILSVEELDLPFDWKVKNPPRNCFVMHLNSSGALYECTVKTISLYNYKIKTPEIDLNALDKLWWLRDEITESGGVHTLKIIFEDSSGHEYRFVIAFENVVVERK